MYNLHVIITSVNIHDLESGVILSEKGWHIVFYSYVCILGTSTLYKILNDCSASVRKCIEGLDYYVAEGGRSFQELEELIQKLTVDEDKKKSLTSQLLSAKSYLKTDYKVFWFLKKIWMAFC